MEQTRSSIRFVAGFVAVTALVCAGAANALQPPPPATGALKQYTAGGHVLGFEPGGYFVSDGTYALRVGFEQAAAVASTADGAAEDADEASRARPFGRVSYARLWGGISLVYDNPASGIVRSTWTLEPGADPAAIRLRYNRDVELTPSGALKIVFATGAMTESPPVAWQDEGGHRQPVEVSFVQLARDVVGFRVGSYRPDLPLTIDPTLTWNTFLGGSGGDEAEAIAVDGASGDVYVAGKSFATWGSPLTPIATSGDAFVARLTPAGSLVWNTFLGGSGEDQAYGIAVGGGGVFVTGQSNATWGSPLLPFSATIDAFVARLTSSGALVWNGFLGGGDFDIGSAIAVDGSGAVYVAGYSAATWGSPIRPYTAGGDAFAARLTPAGGLLWNTFLGGSNSDSGEGIAVDGSGAVYLAGYSAATWGSPMRAYTAMNDGFAAQLTSTGLLVWNTFLGGSGNDSGDAIAVDGSGNVYVIGASAAAWGSPVRAYASASDAFAARLTSAGALSWHTFLGDSGDDFGRAIAVDGGGSVYVTGHSNATWGSPFPAYASGIDAFVARLTSAGALGWSAFLGGSGNDFGFGIAVDDGDVYVAGRSTATWGAPVRAYTASTDAFAAQLAGAAPCPTIPAGGCVVPGAGGNSQLQIRTDPADLTGGNDKLKWKFKGGPLLTQSAFGDPTSGTGYALCVYDDGVLEVTVDVPPSGTSWAPAGSKGYVYKDPAGSADGATTVKLLGGAAGKGKLQMKGKGTNLPPLVPASPTKFFDNLTSVVVQLHEGGGDCYETEFTAADERKNDGRQFKAVR